MNEDRLYARGVSRRLASANTAVIGGLALVVALVAFVNGDGAAAWGILAAGAIVVGSAVVMAFLVGREQRHKAGGAVSVGVYVIKMAVLLGLIAGIQAVPGIDRSVFLLAIAAATVITLVVDSVVVLTYPIPTYSDVEALPWDDDTDDDAESGYM